MREWWSPYICALSMTICKFLAINYFARIVAHRAHIVSNISRIVSPRLRTVRPKLATTIFFRSLSLWPLFLVSQWANWYFQENCAHMVITICALTFRKNFPTSQMVILVRTLIFCYNCPFVQWFTKNHCLGRSPPQGLHSLGLKPFLTHKPGM